MVTGELFKTILQNYEADCKITGWSVVGGGSINNAYKVTTSKEIFFIKTYEGIKDFFAVEVKGLELLRNARELVLPEVIGYGETEGLNFLVLKFIESGVRQKHFWQSFGHKLAALHNHSNSQFGLGYNNYIGSLPQQNTYTSNWIDFFIHQRIVPQLQLAKTANLLSAQMLNQFESLFKKLDSLLPQLSPSLVHGDLWSGNFIVGSNGEPVLIDPAVYYGNREMELAYTRLFGGFDEEFYDAYREILTLTKDFYREREDIYNLYHLLVHLNLFGKGYMGSIEQIIKAYS